MASARSWYHPASIWRSITLQPRTYGGVLAGLVVYLVLWAGGWLETGRILVAWDAGGLVYLAAAFYLMSTCPIQHIKDAAAQDDDSRVIILVLILLSIGASFVAIAHLMQYAKQPSIGEGERAYIAALALTTMITSWSVTQVAFTLHYAHEYYAPDEDSDDAGAGLEFPGSDDPDYWDFLYFATSIGAASQTSDTEVRSQSLRRLVTLHAVISFFFNTAVLALTVNMAASLA